LLLVPLFTAGCWVHPLETLVCENYYEPSVYCYPSRSLKVEGGIIQAGRPSDFGELPNGDFVLWQHVSYTRYGYEPYSKYVVEKLLRTKFDNDYTECEDQFASRTVAIIIPREKILSRLKGRPDSSKSEGFPKEVKVFLTDLGVNYQHLSPDGDDQVISLSANSSDLQDATYFQPRFRRTDNRLIYGIVLNGEEYEFVFEGYPLGPENGGPIHLPPRYPLPWYLYPPATVAIAVDGAVSVALIPVAIVGAALATPVAYIYISTGLFFGFVKEDVG